MELYTDEELGLIDGFVVPYLSWKSESPSLREAYSRVHSHILQNALDREDLLHIRMGLNLFLPCFEGDRTSQTHMIRALATTDRLLQGV